MRDSSQAALAVEPLDKRTLLSAATVSISDVSVTEGDSGNTAVTFDVTLSNTIANNLRFDWVAVEGSALGDFGSGASADYQSIAGSNFGIAAGELTETVTVQVYGDTTVELDEQFFVDFFNLDAGGLDVRFDPDRINAARITEIGSFDTSSFAYDTQVVGSNLFVADGLSGLRVLDISNPADISEVGFFDTPGEARGVQVVGNTAYVADWTSGLRVLDVADPGNITELGSFDTPGLAQAVQVVGNTAYVADGSGGLRVLDVTTPGSISELGSFNTGNTLHVQVIDNTAYVTDATGGLRVLDVSHPTLSGGLQFDGIDDVVVVPHDPSLDPGTGDLTIETWFRTDSTSDAVIAGKYGHGGTNGGGGGDERDFYFFSVSADGSVQLSLRDTNNNLQVVGSPTGLNDNQWHHAAAVRDTSSGRLKMYVDGTLVADDPLTLTGDVTSGNDLTIGATNPFHSNGFANFFDGQLDELRVWTTARSEAEIQAALNSELAGNESGLAAYYKFNDGQGSSIAADSSANSNDGTLSNFDTSTAWVNTIREIGFFDTPGTPIDVQVVDNIAYIADDAQGLRVLDVTNPGSISELGSFATSSLARDVHVVGETAYIANGFDGLLVLDVADPAAISELGSFDTQGLASDVKVVGSTAYFADGGSGVRVLDVDFTARATGTILDDDSATLSVGAASVTEGNNGTTTLSFPVTLSNPVDVDVNFAYMTEDGSATTANGDYVGVTEPAALTIAAGTTSGTIDITVNGDTTVESDEMLRVLTWNIEASGREAEINNPESLNLVFNGDFEAGNTGFTSEYGFAAATLEEGRYGVVTDPQSWHPLFVSNFGDHTTGSGNMMVVNGATISGEVVWETSQPIAVEPNTTYDFATYLASMTPANPANLSFTVNGESIGTLNASSTAGRWDLFFATWNSGTATSATIQIVNLVTVAGGNDFALDDIFFGEAVFSNTAATGTIIDDDVAILSISDVTMEEGDAGVTTFTFDVTLDEAVDNDVTFDFVTVANSAHASPPSSRDYVMKSGSGRITSGSTSTTISVEVIGDTTVEANESFFIDLSNLDGGGLNVQFDPREISSVSASLITVVNTPGFAFDVEVVGSTAYVADRASGLRVLDVSNPTSVSELGAFDTSGQAQGVEVVGNVAYVADSLNGLRALNISNPASITEVGFFDTPGFAWDVQVVGNIAYVSDDTAGLRALNVSNPASITQLGVFNTPGKALDSKVIDGIAYVADESGGLRVLDVSNPASIVELGFYATPNFAQGVDVVNGTAYVATRFSGLRVLDVRNPSNITEIGFFDTPDNANEVQVVGSIAYVTDNVAGLRVLNVSDPANITEIDFDRSVQSFDVDVIGDTAYVVGGSSGLAILGLDIEYTPRATGTIVNDDSATLSVGVASVTEGNSGTTTLSFPVTLSNPVDVDVTFDYVTQNGSATTANRDYVGVTTPATLTIAAGATSGTIDVAVNGDTTVEADETLSVSISHIQASGREAVINDPVSLNLVANGDFEGGNTGFNSDYTFATASQAEGRYGVVTDPSSWHPDFISDFGDHTTGTGNMMVVNGATVAGEVVWKTNQPIAVEPNTTYDFATYLSSMVSTNPANLSFTVNGESIGTLNASSTTGRWDLFFATWKSGTATTANIQIVNLVTVPVGNDFALDDIFFGEAVFSNTVATGTILNDDSATLSVGAVSVTEGNNGTTTLSFPVTLSNPVDVDVNFAYSTDDGSATTANSDYVGVTDPATLTIAAGATSGTIDITVNGDATVEADETLRVVIWNIEASGREAVINDPVSSNLVFNGDFEAGNTGFTSEYSFADASQDEGRYGVVTDPQSWHPLFVSGFGDHTTGSGNMMVVNGATVVGEVVWETTQPIAVEPNTTYDFATYLASMIPANPANLSFTVNGESIGTLNAASTAGRWDLFFATWNSGTATSATIQIVNLVTVAGGNDFALDDIFFGEAVFSNSSATGTIINDDSATLSVGAASVIEGNSGTTTLSFPVTLSNPVDVDVSFAYVTENGSATTANNDYVGVTEPARLTIGAGARSATIEVIVNGDTAVESDETLRVVTWNIEAGGREAVINDPVSSNLVFNGDFEDGNSGFGSHYTFAVASQAEGRYGVVTNPQSWHPQFVSNFVDHTTGSGKMMVVNGATVAGEVVWETNQPISVKRNTTYDFATYLASMTPTNPANLSFTVNGESIGTLNASSTTGRWDLFFATWNSGTATSATIQIVNLVTIAGGNDFALDDIFFGEAVFSNNSATGTIINDEATPQTLTLPGGGGSYEILRVGADLVVRVTGGSEVFRRRASVVTSLTIGGSSSADAVTVLNSGPNSPTAMTTPLIFNGNGGNDRFNASLAFLPVTLNGGAGNDTLIGGFGDDQIDGGLDDDVIRCNSGEDTAIGGGGNDFINGNDGDDTINGNAGNDTIIGGSGNDSINGEDGADSIIGGAGDDLMVGGLGNDRLFGFAGADVLDGSDGNDRLAGGNGNDTVLGGVGLDTLLGEAGDDSLRGGADKDIIRGGDGNDAAFGDDANDLIKGDGGNDTLDGGEGSDSLIGGDDDDVLFGFGGADTLKGSKGNDRLVGGIGNDVLDAGAGRDTLLGEDGNDTLISVGGDDSLNGGTGRDTINGVIDPAAAMALALDTLMAG